MEDNFELTRAVAAALQQRKWRLVTAESCTAGRICATLAIVPGISQSLCGGSIVYRNASKTGWLGISEAVLESESSVSQAVSDQLAVRALEVTPEADLALAITGDIGPGAPAQTDGKCFLAIATRHGQMVQRTITLVSPPPQHDDDLSRRAARLHEATHCALTCLVDCLGELD